MLKGSGTDVIDRSRSRVTGRWTVVEGLHQGGVQPVHCGFELDKEFPLLQGVNEQVYTEVIDVMNRQGV